MTTERALEIEKKPYGQMVESTNDLSPLGKEANMIILIHKSLNEVTMDDRKSNIEFFL